MDNRKVIRRRVYQKSPREMITAFIVLACMYLLASGIVFLLAYTYVQSKYTVYEYAPAHETICQDGWRSESLGQGTCSHHGGVKIWAGGRVSTGRFETGWWNKEKTKLYILAAILISASLCFGAFVATRPHDLSPEDRAKIDEAINSFEKQLKKMD
jgi:hypothetical protein